MTDISGPEKNTILIADDNPLNLKVLTSLLAKKDYRIRPAISGELALRSALKSPPDLILLDILMPGTDGYEVCRQLKAEARTRDIPVIFISALNDMPEKVRAFAVGGVDFITKPFQRGEVLARVSAHLRIRNLQQHLQEKNALLEQEVAERRRAEDALQQAKEALEASNRELEERVQEELKKRQEQQQLLIRKSKLESLGELAAGIAHEINQPLAGISMGLDNMLFRVSSDTASVDETTGDYLRNKIGYLLEDVERINQIIRHVRTFSRDQASVLFEDVDVSEVCANALSMVQAQYKNHNVEIISETDCEGLVIGNKYKLEQVILNLISNAKYAVEEKAGAPTYRKRITVRTFCDADKVYTEVEDNGTGISEADLDHIFNPFFTTKEPERGTGLGLSVCYGIVREMKGEISVRSRFGEYTVMSVALPRI